MPTQLLIRSIEEFLDARSFLEAQREHGDALERALERMHNARVKLREQIEAGRQCYVVYPLVEESEKSQAKAATSEFVKWSELLAPAKCELLHGRIPPEEKDAIMRRFAEA